MDSITHSSRRAQSFWERTEATDSLLYMNQKRKNRGIEDMSKCAWSVAVRGFTLEPEIKFLSELNNLSFYCHVP